MVIHSARFVISNTQLSAMPEAKLPEYAFIGRSNVGKSSLINALVNRKEVAKTSQQPGKTQLINHFMINEAWYIVDLPGYGYAKASKKERHSWSRFISDYLKKRESLQCLMLLIDVRHPPQKIDLEFCEWLGENGIPFYIVFTKADKVKGRLAQENINLFKRELLHLLEEVPNYTLTSAKTKAGCGKILKWIEEINRNFEQQNA